MLDIEPVTIRNGGPLLLDTEEAQNSFPFLGLPFGSSLQTGRSEQSISDVVVSSHTNPYARLWKPFGRSDR